MHTLLVREMQHPSRTIAVYSTVTLALFVIGLGTLGLLSMTGSCDYAEEEGLPRVQARFGFEGRVVTLSMPGGKRSVYQITKVLPGGPMWNAGVRAGDRPAATDSVGSCFLLSALEDSLSGKTGEFGVVRSRSPWSESSEWLTIIIGPLPTGTDARTNIP